MNEPTTLANTADARFDEVLALIHSARRQAVQAVNARLISLYWQVGAYISRKLEQAEWGDAVVSQLAEHLALTQPGLRGFTSRNLFRMRQFYETYRGNEIVSALLTQLPWTHNLTILSQSKHPEEREFYLRMAIQEKCSSRELERQFKAALFEHRVTQSAKVSALLRQTYPAALDVFRDAYMVEFLDLPSGHAEADLHESLLARLKDFLIELGCDFYLEALDRDQRKPHENPSIGVLLCASKDDEVVEYVLNRSLSPALIAQYQTHQPDKQLVQAKLQEFYALDVAKRTERVSNCRQ